MQHVAENPNSQAVSTRMDGVARDFSAPSSLSRFCQVQLDQLTAQAPIVWAQIVYFDPFLQTDQEIDSRHDVLDPQTRRELKLRINSLDLPAVFTLTELFPLSSNWIAYFCPIGYRNYRPEHLIVVSKQALSPALQNGVVSHAKLLAQHCELYTSLYHQHTETQLLEQIIHRVGHQLRNPLSLIALYAENLRLNTSASSTPAQAKVICETVQDLIANLNDLIYCGKSSQLRIAHYDIQLLMAEIIQTLQPWLAEKQINLIYSPNSVVLRVDRVQIRQVFTNLLSNAIHFSPHAGTIQINWQVFQSEVLVQITDQGPGLSETDLKKIFTPFYSKRPSGTGLGLAIAKKIVLDHQGSLWAQNSPDAGAQFSFTLPR